MNNKLKVYCCYHDDTQIKTYNLNDLPNDIYELVYGPSFENNIYLCEFSVLDYMWKTDKTSEYIGLCHYRRTFSDNFRTDLITDNIAQIYEFNEGEEWYDMFSIKRWSGKCKNEYFLCPWLYDDYEDYTIKKYGENNKYIITDTLLYERKLTPKYKIGSYLIGRSTFIVTRKVFMDLCDFVLGFYYNYLCPKYNLYTSIGWDEFFNKWDNYRNDLRQNNPEIQLPWGYEQCIAGRHRILAYMFEILVSEYFIANMDKVFIQNTKHENIVYYDLPCGIELK